MQETIKKVNHDGFSLIEMMVVIAIIGIMMGVAIPSYQRYTKRARYSEIVQAAAPYKLGVAECYQINGHFTDCQNGKNNIPNSIHTHLIQDIMVDQGVIHIIPKTAFGFSHNDDYRLTPTINNGQIEWKTSGGAIEKNYA